MRWRVCSMHVRTPSCACALFVSARDGCFLCAQSRETTGGENVEASHPATVVPRLRLHQRPGLMAARRPPPSVPRKWHPTPTATRTQLRPWHVCPAAERAGLPEDRRHPPVLCGLVRLSRHARQRRMQGLAAGRCAFVQRHGSGACSGCGACGTRMVPERISE